MTDLPGRIQAAVAQAITARTATMLDTCTGVRPGAESQTPTLDADGNVTGGATGSPVYSGPCSIADPRLAPLRNRTPTDLDGEPDQRSLRVPHTADLAVGDLVTITGSAFSPGLVGDEFVIIREDERSYATYRNLIVRGSTSDPTGG